MYNMSEQTNKFLNATKKLVLTATQIFNLNNKVDRSIIDFGNEFIGNRYFMVKSGLIKTIDSTYSKLFTNEKYENKILDFSSCIRSYKYKSDFKQVNSVDVKKNYTKITSNEQVSYVNTAYYMFFTNKINNVELMVKGAVDPIMMYIKDEFVGLFLPMKVTSEEFENDITIEEYEQQLIKENDKKIKANEYEEQDIQDSINHLNNKFDRMFKSFEESEEQIINITYKRLKTCYRFIIVTDKKEYDFINVCDYNLDMGLRLEKKILNIILPTLQAKIQNKEEVEPMNNITNDNQINVLNENEIKTQTKLINEVKKIIGKNNIAEIIDIAEVIKEGFRITKNGSSHNINYMSKYDVRRDIESDNKKTIELYNRLKDSKLSKYLYLEKERACFYYISISIEFNEIESRTCTTCNGSLSLGEFGTIENVKELKCNCCDNGLEYKIKVTCEVCGKHEITWSKNKNEIKNYKCFDCSIDNNQIKEEFDCDNIDLVVQDIPNLNADSNTCNNKSNKYYEVIKGEDIKVGDTVVTSDNRELEVLDINKDCFITCYYKKENGDMSWISYDPKKYMSIVKYNSNVINSCINRSNMFNDLISKGKEIIKYTNDYIIFKNNDFYVLRYFDECINDSTYNRLKDDKYSRISKDLNRIIDFSNNNRIELSEVTI